jgi:hypothetical protein
LGRANVRDMQNIGVRVVKVVDVPGVLAEFGGK